ncbi:spore cortex biosynthesis protein YabQ [Alkalibacillus salilacus]|uniref:Spore cortex biosynthesis protein YabQ n=1 Tax=Alkalibacillus salilacus TaxID=284582 RepID=A0ABT9VC07_9BACI|nr:spore cortex biosynthesis protein YabQ [Alkalibacillus salilacus]
MTLTTQFTTMLVLILCGLLIGAIFDVYKQLVRPHAFKNRLVIDSLFCGLVGVWLYYILFQLNGGALRFYFIIALALGISIYYALFQDIFLRFFAYFLNLLSACFRAIYQLINHVIVKPITWIVRVLAGIVVFVLSIVWRVIVTLFKLIKLLLAPFLPRIVKKYLKQFVETCDNRIRVVWKKLGLFIKKRRRAGDVQEEEKNG